MIAPEEESASKKSSLSDQAEGRTQDCEFPSCKIDWSKQLKTQAPSQPIEPGASQASISEIVASSACKVKFRISNNGQIQLEFENSEACARELAKKDRLRPGDLRYLHLHTIQPEPTDKSE